MGILFVKWDAWCHRQWGMIRDNFPPRSAAGSILFYSLVKSREGKSSTKRKYIEPKDESLPVDRRKYREG